MKNPRTEAWMYLVVGVVAMIGGATFLLIAAGNNQDSNILDWAILIMGAVSVWRGGKAFYDLRQ